MIYREVDWSLVPAQAHNLIDGGSNPPLATILPHCSNGKIRVSKTL